MTFNPFGGVKTPFFSGENMKYRYIGDCNGFSFRGIQFPINEPVDVTDHSTLKKIENNSHFSVVKSRNTKKVTNGNSGGNKG